MIFADRYTYPDNSYVSLGGGDEPIKVVYGYNYPEPEEETDELPVGVAQN